MPQRRAPLLALLLALALVAYPAAMPFAMAGDMASMPVTMHGGQHCDANQQPANHHHHAVSTCCAGVCGSCPVVAVTAGVAPRIGATPRISTSFSHFPAAFERSALLRLPYAIGPPASLV